MIRPTRELWKRVVQLCLFVSALTVFIMPLRASNNITVLEADKSLRSQWAIREIRAEADPTDQQWCSSMGQIALAYESEESGPPYVGLLITDPRGRKIGYDLLADKGWQELPLAQAFFDCAENEDTGELRHCAGRIEICGPVSGAYRVDVLPKHGGKYSISVSGSSRETWDELGFHSSHSRVELKGEIQEQPTTLFLQYSREAGEQIRLVLSDPEKEQTSSLFGSHDCTGGKK